MPLDPDQAFREQIMERGRQDLREQRADATMHLYRPDRLCLLDARYNRAIDEIDQLCTQMKADQWYVEAANDNAEAWMRCLEGALAQAREALKQIRTHTRAA